MTILSREITIPPAILRIPALLVEIGVTAVGIIIAIDRLSTTRSWWSAVPKLDEYLAWTLLADVLLAFALALRVERRRWIRNVSITFHFGLVLLSAYAVEGFYLGD